jgi:hypothetical protein
MQTATVAKDQNFKMRLDEADRERLDALAAHYALSVAGVIRMLIKRDADAIGVVVKQPTKKRAKR